MMVTKLFFVGITLVFFVNIYSCKHYNIKEDVLLQLQNNSSFSIPDLQMDMIFVQAGKFKMGSNCGDTDEKPIHTVIISRDFYIGKTEVTQAQYKVITGKTPSLYKGENLPVERVSWNDAIKFCKLLTKRELMTKRIPKGYKYTLPSEAQWEYAARGGNNGKGFKYSGSDKVDAVAWYIISGCQKTSAVAVKQANELGLYDMSGNVWEWCLDSCGWNSGIVTDTYKDNIVDPLCSAGLYRVNRGGSWYGISTCCRSANRYGVKASNCFNNLGFRVVLVSVDK